MQLTAQHRQQQITRVTIWGVAVNLALAATKLVGGFLGHSHALIADGMHSISDLISDGMVYIAAKHASADADEEHPYGHARFETIATVALAVLLFLVGIGIAWDAVDKLTSSEPLPQPDLFTLWIAAGSILSNEALYHYTQHVGKRIRSKLLAANAWHHRSDAVSSIVVLIGIAGTQFDLDKLDAFAAIVVAVMIMHIGFKLGYDSVQELADAALDPEKVEQIREIILQNEGVRQLHMLRTRKMGHNALVDVHIQVGPRLSVSEGHHISETVEKSLIDALDEINDVTVHIDPENDEMEARNMDLPLRSDLMSLLRDAWSANPAFEHIDDITLHYLTGEISVEACMPLTRAGSLENSRKLQSEFSEITRQVEYIGEATLKFH